MSTPTRSSQPVARTAARLLLGLLIASTAVAVSGADTDGPGVPDAIVDDPAGLLQQAYDLMEDQRYEQAVPLLKRLVEIDPENDEGWTNLGVSQMALERWNEAIEALKAAGRVSRDPSLVYYNLACLHSTQGRADEAIDWLEKSLKEGFGNPDHLARDPDLDPIREHPRFAELYTPPVWSMHPDAEVVSFQAEGGLAVHAVLYEAGADRRGPVILLFHQSASNAAEYQTIVPRLNDAGGRLAGSVSRVRTRPGCREGFPRRGRVGAR